MSDFLYEMKVTNIKEKENESDKEEEEEEEEDKDKNEEEQEENVRKTSKKLNRKYHNDYFNSSLTQIIFRIIQSNSCFFQVKLFLFVAGTTILASIMVAESIMIYLSFEVKTTSRTKFETSSLFPQITICNRNIFQTEFAIEFLRNVTKERFPRLQVDAFDLEQVRQNLSLEQRKFLFKLIHKRG